MYSTLTVQYCAAFSLVQRGERFGVKALNLRVTATSRLSRPSPLTKSIAADP